MKAKPHIYKIKDIDNRHGGPWCCGGYFYGHSPKQAYAAWKLFKGHISFQKRVWAGREGEEVFILSDIREVDHAQFLSFIRSAQKSWADNTVQTGFAHRGHLVHAMHDYRSVQGRYRTGQGGNTMEKRP